MSGNIEILASYWTLAGGAQPHTDREYSPFDFRDRVQAAARAGFKGVGIWHADLEFAMKTYSLKQMRQILTDNGIVHLELEFLGDWFVDGERRRVSDACRKMLLEAASALGARHIKVGDFTKEPCAMPRLIEEFAQLCRDGADHDTRIVFELMPFANVDTLEGALALVQGAGASNGGIIIDLWHMAKMGVAYERIAAIPPQYLLGVEVNDGTYKAPWSMHEDTINHRLLPGEGEFEVARFVKTVLAGGYKGPWGVEVLNNEMRKWPLEKLAQRAFQTTCAQFPS